MYAIVKLRGEVKTRQDIRDTLRMLRLDRVNHCVIVPETPTYHGMIHKAKDYVAWESLLRKHLQKCLRIEASSKAGMILLRNTLVRTPHSNPSRNWQKPYAKEAHQYLIFLK